MSQENKVPLVRGIFEDFFGEDRVDVQNRDSDSVYIIVHFPQLTVTNENSRSIDITHLYAKMRVTKSTGTIIGTFQLIRSEYTSTQFISGYSFSHIPHVSRDKIASWQNPCLGTGPLNDTVATLNIEYSEEFWQLFCLELSKYVTVESVEGVPYMYLEKVGKQDLDPVRFPLIREIRRDSYSSEEAIDTIKEFTRFVIYKRPFNFHYLNGSYNIAASDETILITLSNLYIEWYNSLNAQEQEHYDLADAVLRKAKMRGNELCYVYNSSRRTTNYKDLIGTKLFTFKGEWVLFNVIEDPVKEDENVSLILSESFASIIIDKILNLANYGYYFQFDTREKLYFI